MTNRMNTEVFLFCQRYKESYADIIFYEVLCIEHYVESYLE